MERNEESPAYAAIFPIVLLLLACWVWGRRFGASLWIDETLTAWITSSSKLGVFERTFQFQGQSPLYYFLSFYSQELLGESTEWALRFPSFLFGLGTLVVSYFIFRNWFGKELSFLGVFFVLISDGALFVSASARPYSGALFFSSLTLLWTLKWARSKSLLHFLVAGLSQAFAVSFHYFFVGNLIPVFLFLLFSTGAFSEGVSFFRKILFLLWLCTASGIIFFLNLEHLFFLRARAEEIAISGEASVVQLILLLLQPAVLFPFLIAYFLAPVVVPKDLEAPEAPEAPKADNNPKLVSLFLPLLWIVLPAGSLFLVANLLESGTLFSERYLLPHLLSCPLFFLVLVSRLKTKRAAYAFFAVFLTLSLAGDFLKTYPREDWRSAVSTLKRVPPDVPVLFYSGLFESQSVSFLSHSKNRGYLTAPLLYYRYQRKVDLVPFRLGGDDQWELWQSHLEMLRGAKKGALLIHEAVTLEGEDAGDYFSGALEAEGFQVEKREQFPGIALLSFQVQPEPSS